MSKLRIAPLIVLAGCFVAPVQTTTARQTGTREGIVTPGPDRDLVLAAHLEGDKLAVHATRKRRCQRQVLAVIETESTRHFGFSAPDDPRARVFGLLLSPLTLPVSSVVTAFVVAVDTGAVDQHTRLDHVEEVACDHPAASIAVEVALPSGATVASKTDAHGLATFELPDAEPDRGTVIARSEQASLSIPYARAVPAVSFVRDTLRACAAKHGVTGALRLELGVDSRGYPVRIQLGAGNASFHACVSTALAKLRFPPADARTFVFPLELPG